MAESLNTFIGAKSGTEAGILEPSFSVAFGLSKCRRKCSEDCSLSRWASSDRRQIAIALRRQAVRDRASSPATGSDRTLLLALVSSLSQSSDGFTLKHPSASCRA